MPPSKKLQREVGLRHISIEDGVWLIYMTLSRQLRKSRTTMESISITYRLPDSFPSGGTQAAQCSLKRASFTRLMNLEFTGLDSGLMTPLHSFVSLCTIARHYYALPHPVHAGYLPSFSLCGDVEQAPSC